MIRQDEWEHIYERSVADTAYTQSTNTYKDSI